MWYYNSDHPLRRYFSGLTEQAFIEGVGMADPEVIDYLSLLLARFVPHRRDQPTLHSQTGRRLEEVADMLLEAEAMPPASRTSREVHRHIGDYTLFWTGVYPEDAQAAARFLAEGQLHRLLSAGQTLPT
ncbi:MAG: hypothetical protein U0793_02870 [Gemmataceae bacterium]